MIMSTKPSFVRCPYCRHKLEKVPKRKTNCPDCGKHINVFGESHVDEVAAKHGLPVLAKCPIDPKLAELSDAGMIETYGGEYLEGAADACEKLLKK